MSQQLRHSEIEGQLGAYAVDSLDAEDRLLIEGHLTGCPSCRDEVSVHRQVIAAFAPDDAPPADVWEGIAGRLEDAPPPLDLAPVASLAEHRPARFRILAATTAVAAAAAAVLGVRVIDQDRRLDQMQTATASVLEAANAAASDPDATNIDLRSSALPANARVVLLPDGRGYILAGDLPDLAPDRTYQLWALVDGQAISAGTLGPRPEATAFHMSGPVNGFAVTDEAAGGVVASDNDPVVIGFAGSA